MMLALDIVALIIVAIAIFGISLNDNTSALAKLIIFLLDGVVFAALLSAAMGLQ